MSLRSSCKGNCSTSTPYGQYLSSQQGLQTALTRLFHPTSSAHAPNVGPAGCPRRGREARVLSISPRYPKVWKRHQAPSSLQPEWAAHPAQPIPASSDNSLPTPYTRPSRGRSEEHTSELQSLRHLVC